MAPDAGALCARRRFTLEEYHRLGEAGILDEDERVELIEGDIVQLTPIGPTHAGTVSRLAALLIARLGGRAIVSPQNPVLLRGQRSEPQPDLVLLRPRSDFYTSGHPEPADILLLIEVMDSSAPYDRRIKLPLYARAGVREVWLVDLAGRAVETSLRPMADGYADHRVVTGAGTLAPEAFPDLALTLADVFG